MISSRTPEGEPAKCPLCAADVIVEPSILIGDATCPQCGHLLWFIQFADQAFRFEADRFSDMKERVIDIIARRFGLNRETIANNRSLMHQISADSLEVVELVLELEEVLDLP